MEYCYRFGGLLIASQIELPGLRPESEPDEPPDTHFALGADACPPAEQLIHWWGGTFGLRLWESGGDWLFTTTRFGAVLISRDGRRVTGFPSADEPRGGFFDFLRGRVLPRLAVLRGALALHAAAVGSQDGALLLVGKSGAGKSTLGAALAARHGWTLLADDAAILDIDALSVRPSARGATLWPDSRAALDMTGGTSLPHHAHKHWIADAGPAATTPLPLKAIVFLNRGADRAAPGLSRLPAFETFTQASRNILRFRPGDPPSQPPLVEALGRLANAVPGLRLDYPSDYAAIPDVSALLEGCLKTSAPA